MKLTIILTVYNKAPFLERAFDRLLRQDGVNGEDYEVLVINDGSTDGSLSLCEDYAKRDKRIRIITQENKGLSMARNNGVDAANGDYVWFVDSDDMISKEAVRLICEATKSAPDVIPIYAQTEGVNKVRNMVKESVKSGRDILTTGDWEQCGVFNVLRRNFVLNNKLRFMPGVYHEDAEFTPRMLYAAKSVEVVPQVLYTVYREPNSITTIPRVKRAFDCLTVSESLSKFIIDHGENGSKIGQSIDGSASVVINNGFAIILQNSRNDQKQFDEFFYQKRKLLLRTLFAAPIVKYRLEAILFMLFPKHYVGVYKAMKWLC